MSHRLASVERTVNKEWTNLHGNVSLSVGEYLELWNPMPPSLDAVESDMGATSDLVRRLLADAARNGTSLRSVGGAWSLSPVATSSHTMLGTRNLNHWFPLAARSISPECTIDHSALYYFQCGSSVGEVYKRLERNGRTLPTSGASNGQTIAGAVSTGTHGSAFRYGALQDCIRAIHCIVGPNEDDVLLLERNEQRVASDGLAQRLGARLFRDTELFNAALVAFGSMGFVMGYILESDELYHLESWRRRIPFTDTVRTLMSTLDVSLLPALVPSISVDEGRLWHVEVVINPHDAASCFLTVMERWSQHRPLSRREGAVLTTPGDDVLSVVGALTAGLPAAIPAATKALLAAMYADRGPVVATPMDTFTAATVRGTALSAELGVPMERSVDAVQRIMSLPETKRYAGIIACRYVRASDALLGFTMFPITCTIELPGVYTKGTEDFLAAVYESFAASDIPHTAHWGQIHLPGLDIVQAYGNRLRRWIEAREHLLSPAMRAVFDHPYVPNDGHAGPGV